LQLRYFESVKTNRKVVRLRQAGNESAPSAPDTAKLARLISAYAPFDDMPLVGASRNLGDRPQEPHSRHQFPRGEDLNPPTFWL